MVCPNPERASIGVASDDAFNEIGVFSFHEFTALENPIEFRIPYHIVSQLLTASLLRTLCVSCVSKSWS